MWKVDPELSFPTVLLLLVALLLFLTKQIPATTFLRIVTRILTTAASVVEDLVDKEDLGERKNSSASKTGTNARRPNAGRPKGNKPVNKGTDKGRERTQKE
jgi:hypothetical protein